MSDLSDRQFVDCTCSRTGKVWYAAIEKYGTHWRFVDHVLPDEYKALQHEARKEARKRELLQRLNALTQGNGPVLPPPPQVDIKPVFQDAEISGEALSTFGFECPYCGEADPLRCAVCNGISCMGEVDNNKRTVCVRCQRTLQFTDSPGSGSKVSVPVKTQKSGLQAIENALPDISQQKLLPGQEK